MESSSKSLFDHPDIGFLADLDPICALDSLEFDSFYDELNASTRTGSDNNLSQPDMDNLLLWLDSDLAEDKFKQAAQSRDLAPQNAELKHLEADWSLRLFKDDPKTALIDFNGSSWSLPEYTENASTMPQVLTTEAPTASQDHCGTCVCGSMPRHQNESGVQHQSYDSSLGGGYLSFLGHGVYESSTILNTTDFPGLGHSQPRAYESQLPMSDSEMGLVMSYNLDELVRSHNSMSQFPDHEATSSNSSVTVSSELSAMAVCPSQVISPSVHNSVSGNELSDWRQDSDTGSYSSSSGSSPMMTGCANPRRGHRGATSANHLNPGFAVPFLPRDNVMSTSQSPSSIGHSSASVPAIRPAMFDMSGTATSSGSSSSGRLRGRAPASRKRTFDSMAVAEASTSAGASARSSEGPQRKRRRPANYDIRTANRDRLIKEVVEPIRNGGLYGLPSKLINGWAYATKQWMYGDLIELKVRGKKLFRPGFKQMHIADLRELVEHCRSGLPWQSKVISLGHLTVEQKVYFNLY
ncbi:protein of unknown function [Taphrina deformans PYCC 5710]|uniref:Uncharacterized protein n=1 Tax=Taphrina deformans (strain PYCC 5710 / ATCC 11124 / CBS 356.35 / IMI 108563 / JCM 9778 / NBRC 8474) TaxID=1097556 RepID=R4XDH0_TAPDE|nr:protein of unknown function [Taphrina deformans PYCC 5710]|eukprot:CCG83926.1 protein of unknown function [Taphrina deformans PYCC 5710]